MSIYEEIDNFVTEKGGFVSPEKITAIDLYGFEKAKEIWEGGGPDNKTLHKLRVLSCENAIKDRNELIKFHRRMKIE